MVVESPFPHEADAVGNDAVDDQLGVVAQTEILAEKGIILPYLIDERLLACVELVGYSSDAELVMFRGEIA